MKTADKIKVMQAFVNGKEIQFKPREGKVWIEVDSNEAIWNWNQYDYRVKPKEPMEVWIYTPEHFHEEWYAQVLVKEPPVEKSYFRKFREVIEE